MFLHNVVVSCQSNYHLKVLCLYRVYNRPVTPLFTMRHDIGAVVPAYTQRCIVRHLIWVHIICSGLSASKLNGKRIYLTCNAFVRNMNLYMVTVVTSFSQFIFALCVCVCLCGNFLFTIVFSLCVCVCVCVRVRFSGIYFRG